MATHLSLAMHSASPNNVLSSEAPALRRVLFKLIDMDTPFDIQQVSDSSGHPFFAHILVLDAWMVMFLIFIWH